jgi:hypothetical protein
MKGQPTQGPSREKRSNRLGMRKSDAQRGHALQVRRCNVRSSTDEESKNLVVAACRCREGTDSRQTDICLCRYLSLKEVARGKAERKRRNAREGSEGKRRLTRLHQRRVPYPISIFQHLRPSLPSRLSSINLIEDVKAGFDGLNRGRDGGDGVLKGSAGVLFKEHGVRRWIGRIG